MANIYITTESESKLKSLFVNTKDFFALDVQQLISEMNVDLTKTSSIYLINEAIERTIMNRASLKRVHGIFYIVQNISEQLILSIKKRLSKLNDIDNFILIDNGFNPKHQKFAYLFSDVIFYERFKKNKIIYQADLKKESDGDKDRLTLLLEDIDNS